MNNSNIQSTTIKGWIICALGAIFYCYEYLLRIEPSVMVPELSKYFDLPPHQFGAFVSLYYLAYTPMQFLVGIIMDIYPPRYILSSATLICTLGSLLFCTSDQMLFAALGRFLIGIGSAFAFVGALKLASDFLPKNRFAFFSGLVTSLGMLGAFIGNIAISHSVKILGWQTTLHVSTLAGFILLIFMWPLLKTDSLDNAKFKKQFDYAFFSQQLRNVFSNKSIWKISAVGSLLFLSISVFAELWGITFLKQVYHLTPYQAAFANSMIFLGWVIGAPINGYLSDNFLRKDSVLMVGGVLTCLIMTCIIYLPFNNIFYLNILLLLLGAASSTQALCFVLARELGPKNLSATIIAFVNVVVMLGGLLVQPLIGILLHHLVRETAVVNSYQAIFSLFPVAFLLGSVIAYLIKPVNETTRVNSNMKFPSDLPIN